MATLVKEIGTSALTQFVVPTKGTWNSVAANMISDNSIYQSMNVFIRKGKLRTRPGLDRLNDTLFDGVVIGGEMAVTPTGKVLLAITKSCLYTLSVDDIEWSQDTIINMAASDQSIIDICFIETSNKYVAIIANGETALKQWVSGEGVTEITVSNGTVPIAKSVCVAARRVVALVNPHTIRWTSVLDYTNWSDLNYNKIAQTNDEAICIRPLGTLDFVIYKERSIYLAKAQAGSDASAFNIKFIQRCEGPAGIHAVVDADGQHIYMTASGRIGLFNGSSLVTWIADGLWLHLQSDIDVSWAYKISGVYDYRLHTITFFYPRNGDFGVMRGLVIINLPLQGSGVNDYAAFTGVSAVPVSHAYEMRFKNTIPRSLSFSSTSNEKQCFIFDEFSKTDDSLYFECSFQTGLFPLPEMKHHMCSVESFLERGDGFGSVTIEAVKSDALENETGSVDLESMSVINLEFNPIQEHVGLAVHSRFIGLKYTWLSSSQVIYGGAVLNGRASASVDNDMKKFQQSLKNLIS